jgi:hypothetical protein
MKSWSCSMVVSVPSGFVRTKRKDQSWDGWRVEDGESGEDGVMGSRERASPQRIS